MGATALAVVLVGYGTADAADAVPGPLTLRPLPAPAAPFPRIAPPPDTSPAAVLAAPDTGAPSPADVAARLGPVIASSGLPGLSVSVADAATGRELFALDADTPRTPASTVKLLTAAAALDTLGAEHRFTTRVVAGGDPDQIVLVGGGDVLLGTIPTAAGDPAQAAAADTRADGRASLADLAASTAAALARDGRHEVRVGVDDTLFTGPASHPGWGAGDVAGGYVAPIAALAVHAGRTAWPEDRPRSTDPALTAGQDFARLLADHGIQVQGDVTRAAAPRGAALLGQVESAPLAEVIRTMLLTSDNVVADALGRSVALSQELPATFERSTAAVVDRVARLGVDTRGLTLADPSGLAAGTAVTARQLTGLLHAATDGRHPGLAPLVGTLPVAGVSGTLADRYRSGPAAAGAGLVRAKTGTLTGVMSLAGTVVDAGGHQLLFAVIANGVPAPEALEARAAGDRITAALIGG